MMPKRFNFKFVTKTSGATTIAKTEGVAVSSLVPPQLPTEVVVAVMTPLEWLGIILSAVGR